MKIVSKQEKEILEEENTATENTASVEENTSEENIEDDVKGTPLSEETSEDAETSDQEKEKKFGKSKG